LTEGYKWCSGELVRWQEDLAEGQQLLADGKFEEAYRVAERLNRNREVGPSSGVHRFMFHAACMVRATAHADALAKRMSESADDEDQFTAASWFQSLAADAYAAGRLEEAIAQLDECMAIAPQHREQFLADPRIIGLVPAFEAQERASDPSKPKPPPPLPDAGPMPPLAKKALKAAADYARKGKWDDAWQAIGRLRVNDFHREDALLLAFEIARRHPNHADFAPVAMGIAQLLKRGSRAQRKVVAAYLRDFAITALNIGRPEIAVKALKEAMQGMGDLRDYFAEDPGLAKLLETI
jgi:tetratricopeptide (TPR) repeat protein